MYRSVMFILACAVADRRVSCRPSRDLCKLPVLLEYGNYTVVKQAKPDDYEDFGKIRLKFTCDSGYSIVGASTIYCSNGTWSGKTPKCAKDCHLNRKVGVEYLCRNKEKNEERKPCNDRVTAGSTIEPNCVGPYYHSKAPLPLMTCNDGVVNNNAKCEPVCGLKLPMTSRPLHRRRGGGGGIGGGGGGGSGGGSWGGGTDPPPDVGRTPIDTDLPWHVGIYSKLKNPYSQTCGGSIVAYNLVISAAHCFWNSVEGLQPASRFAVGAGKVYRPWDDPRDNKAQKSDVAQIIVPPRFWGAHTNFQDDIALVFQSTPFVFDRFVWPICLDFDEHLDKSHLNVGSVGKVTGWGLTEANGAPSPVLQILDLPYIDTYRCIADAQTNYRQYITSDKICAGHTNGTAVCRGDSGGGLAFFEAFPGGDGMRYYLRGIASTVPTNENLCNTFTITSFTKVSKHECFIKSQYGKVMWYPDKS